MKIPMKLQGLLMIVPMSDYEELSNIRDRLVLEEKTNRALNSLDDARDTLNRIWGLVNYALQQGGINDGT